MGSKMKGKCRNGSEICCHERKIKELGEEKEIIIIREGKQM